MKGKGGVSEVGEGRGLDFGRGSSAVAARTCRTSPRPITETSLSGLDPSALLDMTSDAASRRQNHSVFRPRSTTE